MAAEMVAVVVASYFGGEALASAIYTPAGAAAGGAAAGAAGATASGAAAGTAASGWLAGSVAAGTLTAGEATTIAVTAGGAAGGFIGGTLSGVFAGENFGQTMRGAFESAGEAAAFAFAGSELLNARPIAPSWSGAEGAVVTSAARYGVNAFAEKQLGINGWEFDAGLEAISYLGYKAFGDPYSREAQGNQGIFSYIGGFGDRNSRTGWFLQSGGLAHYAGEFLFDVNDQLLQWQGLPDAGGIARAYHGWALPQTGHSLGASRLVTMASLGLIDGGTAVALPFGEVAPGGVQTLIGSGDIIPGSYGGLLFNPEATTGSVPFITGHMLTQYVKAFPNL